MNFEPQKFFIGLIDFFSVLMPGAAVAYLIKESSLPLFGQSVCKLQSSEDWMVFLFVSYLAGHIAFLLGAVLDDWVYDPLKKGTYLGQIERLAAGRRPSSRPVRWLVRRTFGKDRDAALIQVLRMKSRALAPMSAETSINAFQWCKCLLSKEHQEGLLSVQRFEADSKFFRSFVVVLVVVIPLCVWGRHWWWLATCGVLIVAVISRYVDQRFKATQQAYWLVLTLAGMKGGSPVASPKRAATEPTHAGGAVFRESDGATKYLLVRSTDRADWVLPKGHIEAGEDPRQTAVREVLEETGEWARVVEWIQDIQLGHGDAAPLVRFFLMELVSEENWPAENREREWLVLDAAKSRVSFEESRAVLAAAEARRVAGAKSASPRTNGT